MEHARLEQIGQEHVTEIERIMHRIECPKDFRCYKSGMQVLCAAKDIGTDICLECLEDDPHDCKFMLCVGDSYLFGDVHLCSCPVRVYICRVLKK